MTESSNPLEARVAELETQVASLSAAVAELQATQGAPSAPAKVKPVRIPAKPGEASEEILSWVDKAYILPRIATTSFILVVAMALRIASDSGTIDLELGSFIGMLYAFGLIVYGWFSYRENGVHAPVFTLWGTVVMCAVVVEAHRVFATVPAELAYFTLALTGAVNTIMSRMNRVALPVFVGTIGMSFGAFAIDYPSPVFPYLVVIIALANIFATYATRLLRASWLRWLLLVLTLFMIQIWDLKLAIYLSKLSPDKLEFSIQGFLPSIGFLGMVFAVIALLGVLGKIQEKVSKFDVVLPVINVCWIYLAGHYALDRGLADPALFGWGGVAGAVAHLAVAWWLARRKEGGSLGTTSFALAGGLLLAFAAPAAFGHALIATALVALLAVAVARVSDAAKSPGLRLVSYLLQFYACTSLVMLLRTTEGTTPSLVGAASSGLLATIAFYHYWWSRKTPAPEGGEIYRKINKKDRGAGVLLIAALFSGFFTLRVGLYQALDMLHMATPRAFGGAQSVLINVTAAVLLWLSLNRRSKELRNVAVVVTVIGGVKVFLMDMVALKGVSLIISLFSFGVVAALASYLLGRWSKLAGDEAKTETNET